MEALFSMLCKAFPSSNKVPKSYSDAKKTMKDLGLDYTKINAYLNDCILYRGANDKADSSPVCGISRWKNEGHNNVSKSRRRRVKKVPHKVF
uniref:Transposon protein, putative, CACTA, En/Spm sub-class n=1 Tax=Oryza sativa subsp. japonica TaxID=39947 RepID=Q2QU25_ORYSJ|nr:transposon protein, putative, CACTA, En/Spm sub-class [Oryza sativa Japonica Group]